MNKAELVVVIAEKAGKALKEAVNSGKGKGKDKGKKKNRICSAG